jgi:hypothetical protein
MKRSLLIAFVVIAVMLLIGIIAVSRLNLGAIAEPSRAEVYFATAAKHLLVRVATAPKMFRRLPEIREASREPTNCMGRQT